MASLRNPPPAPVIAWLLALTALVVTPGQATAFNPSCDQQGKALEFELFNVESLKSNAADPVPITVPIPYLPIPPEHYKTETVSLVIRAIWPSLKPACMEPETFAIGPNDDPAAVMIGQFDRLITLQIAGNTGLDMDRLKQTQLRMNPHDRGLTPDGGLRIYGASPAPDTSQDPTANTNPTMPVMPPDLGGFPRLDHGELLIPVDEAATPLAWMLCVKLPLPAAPHQCQARLRVNKNVQAEVTFNRKLLDDWPTAMQATADLIERFIGVADSQPL